MSVTGIWRTWLETVAPPRPDPRRVTRKCPECKTWCIGTSKVEAADRLADHRERCHG